MTSTIWWALPLFWIIFVIQQQYFNKLRLLLVDVHGNIMEYLTILYTQ